MIGPQASGRSLLVKPPLSKRRFLEWGIGVGLLSGAAWLLRRTASGTGEKIPEHISPAIFATRVVETRQGTIVYHTSGAGEPLVFLHGLAVGASSYEWSKIYPLFAHDYMVAAPDFIGFGESERPREALSVLEQVESLTSFLQATSQGQTAVIVASGVGCHAALLLAARHPERVRRLILFLPARLNTRAKLQALGFGNLGRLPFGNRTLYHNRVSQAAHLGACLQRAGLEGAALEEAVGIVGRCARQYGAEHAILKLVRQRETFDATARLADVTCPVTVLWPGRAVDFPASEASAMCEAIPRASLEILAELGWSAPLASPASLEEAIRRWLAPAPVNP